MGTKAKLEGHSPRAVMDDLSSNVKPSSRSRSPEGNTDLKPSRVQRDRSDESRSTSDRSLQESTSKTGNSRDPRPSSTRSSRQNLRRSLSSSVLHQRSKSVGLERSHRKGKRSSFNDLQSSSHGVKGSATHGIDNRDPPPSEQTIEKKGKAPNCDKSSATSRKERRSGDSDALAPSSHDRKSTKTDDNRRKKMSRSVSASILTGRKQRSGNEIESKTVAVANTPRDPRKLHSPKRSTSTGTLRESTKAEESAKRSTSKEAKTESPKRDRINCCSSSSQRSSSVKRSRRRDSDPSLERTSVSHDELGNEPSKRASCTDRNRESLTSSSHRDKRSSSAKRSGRRKAETGLDRKKIGLTQQDDSGNASGHSENSVTMDLSRRSRSMKRSSSEVLPRGVESALRKESQPNINRDDPPTRSKSLKRSKSALMGRDRESSSQTKRVSSSEKVKNTNGVSHRQEADALEASTRGSKSVDMDSSRSRRSSRGALGSINRKSDSRHRKELAESSRSRRQSKSKRQCGTQKRRDSPRNPKSRRGDEETDGDTVSSDCSNAREHFDKTRRASQNDQCDNSSRSDGEIQGVESYRNTTEKQALSTSEHNEFKVPGKVSKASESGARECNRNSESSRDRPRGDSRRRASSRKRTNRQSSLFSEEIETEPQNQTSSQTPRRSSKGSRASREGTDRRSTKEGCHRRSSKGSRDSRSSTTEVLSDSSVDSWRRTRSHTESQTASTGIRGAVAINYEEALAKCTERFQESSESEEDVEVPSRSATVPNQELDCESAPGGRSKRTRTWARSKTSREERARCGDDEQESLAHSGKVREIDDDESNDEECDAHVHASAESDSELSGNDYSDFYLADSDDESQSHDNIGTITKHSSFNGRSNSPPGALNKTTGLGRSDTSSVIAPERDRSPASIELSTVVGGESKAEGALEEPCCSGDFVHERGVSSRPNRRRSERRTSFSSNGSCRLSRGNLRRSLSDEINLSGLADLAGNNDDEKDLVSEWEKSEEPAKTKNRVQFVEDIAKPNGVACTFLKPDMELTEEDVETIWYTGQNYKDVRNFCIKETLSARENESYTSRFNLVWAACDTESTSASWQELMSAPHTKDAPNNAVMLAKARYRGFEREVFSPILVRYRKFAIKYIVRQYYSLLQSDTSDNRTDTLLREASEKCSEPFRRYARLIAEGDGLLVAAWDGTAQQSRRKLERTYSGLSVVSESYMVAGEAEDPADERKDLLQSLKSSGSCRHLMSKKKQFDNPAFRCGNA